MLRTHCCRHKCLPVFPLAQHLLRTQILCPGHKSVSDFVQKHFVSATNVSQFARARKRHEQQCFCNNLSSSASTVIHIRRRGRRILKMCFYFTLEFLIYFIDLFSVSVGIKTCTRQICYECVQFQIEIRKISRCGSRSPNNAELGYFTLFCRGRQRNVPRIITHVHSYCSAH